MEPEDCDDHQQAEYEAAVAHAKQRYGERYGGVPVPCRWARSIGWRPGWEEGIDWEQRSARESFDSDSEFALTQATDPDAEPPAAARAPSRPMTRNAARSARMRPLDASAVAPA